MTKKTQNSAGKATFRFLTACQHKIKFDEQYLNHFHPCNSALFLQTTASVLLYRIFLSN